MRCPLGAMGVLIWRGMVDVMGVADVSGALGVVGVCVSGRVYWGDRGACPAAMGAGYMLSVVL